MTGAAEYVLPVRWQDDADLDDLTMYLRELSAFVDVTVVDGSSPELFARHSAAWSPYARVLPPQPWPGRNGKVRGVMTGLRLARHDMVVIADDDVRYSREALIEGLGRLEHADLVAPQNVFTDWPWHARWDTGRQLLNRAFGSDYPGTLVVRRSSVLPEGYDGDVLFENLELMRTVASRGGVIERADDLYVARRTPTAAHFLSQRVRQAYDDFAQPGRLVVEAALLPTVVALRRRPTVLALLVLAAVALAETGRRRAGGGRVFPRTAALWAPLWVLERAVCVWLAIGRRATGGIPYGDGRIRRAASSRH
ncbi:MAG TPA: glycosyltransferase family 2 protein [Propionibacteriaceae bacterium]|nr:glycosyltransferase family 2 protein [Propionibacteriaceae bacterium]